MLPSPASFEGLDTPSAWYDPLRPHQHLYQQTSHLAERRGFQVVIFFGNIRCCATDWSILGTQMGRLHSRVVVRGSDG